MMKAITIIQPWASLLACGAKQFETRSWPTKYRGPIAIHAGMKKPSDMLNGADNVDVIFAMIHAFGIPQRDFASVLEWLDALPRGAVVATANLVECRPTHGRKEIVCVGDFRVSRYVHVDQFVRKDELPFGDFTAGRFAWELADIKPLETPVKTRGYQGLWDWNEGGAA